MVRSADFLTIDVYDHPPRGPWAWSRSVRTALKQPISGLRSVTVNHSNHATHSLSPRTIVQPGRAHRGLGFTSRAAFHPGHRGSVDVSSRLPFEHTSVSLWQTVKLARDYAYAPGGHAHAMNHARAFTTHRVGCFLQVRPLRCSGALGMDTDAFPDLPPAMRA